jgi:hypothetical protein
MMHVLTNIATARLENVSLKLLNVTITTYVLSIPVSMANVYTTNHKTNVMTMICAPLIPAAHLLVASTPILTAMITTLVLKTLAILLLDAVTLRLTAMMIMLVPMMIVTLLLDV